VAYCYSLAIGTEPTQLPEKGDVALEIEWPTFAGPIRTELAALTVARATAAAVSEQDIARYVRSHLERGLSAIQNVRSVSEIATMVVQ